MNPELSDVVVALAQKRIELRDVEMIEHGCPPHDARGELHGIVDSPVRREEVFIAALARHLDHSIVILAAWKGKVLDRLLDDALEDRARCAQLVIHVRIVERRQLNVTMRLRADGHPELSQLGYISRWR